MERQYGWSRGIHFSNGTLQPLLPRPSAFRTEVALSKYRDLFFRTAIE